MLARVCYVVQFLMVAAIGLVFVFLADLQDDFGLSDTELGIVAAAGFLAALVSQLALAPFVDRGRAGAIAWLGVALSAAGSIWFGLASEVVGFAGGRGLVGIGLGLFGMVARKALIGLDVAGGGAKVGALLSAGVAGFIAGPAIGAMFSSFSFATPFVVMGVATAVPGAAAALLISRTEVATTEAQHGDLGELLRRPRVQAAIITQFVLFGFIGIFDATVDRFFTDLGFSTTEIAVGLVLVGLPLLVLPRRAGALAERVGGGRVVLPAVTLVTPVMVAYGWIDGVAVFVLVGSLYTISESFGMMGAQVLILEAAGAERAASGSAILEAIGMFVAALTAVAGPLVYGAYGAKWLFGGWAIVSLAMVLLLVARLRRVTTPSALEAQGDPQPLPTVPPVGSPGLALPE